MDAVASLVVGIIRGAHGLAGKFKVESTSGEIDHFFDLTEVTLRKDGIERLSDVESIEGGHPFLIMKCTGIDTPEEASKLAGGEIVVPRDKACPLHDGEFYVEDLKNCALIYEPVSESDAKDGLKEGNPEAIVAGIVTDVLEGGAGDLLEVSVSESLLTASASGDDSAKKRRTVLVPFKKEFIGDVDISRKTMQLMHLWILE
ncbi:MAG: ribosome maturation factor RimM [Treponemataceae bacterium]|nr:ribosome maturation factor RimM [Treponemataceae bacterium]